VATGIQVSTDLQTQDGAASAPGGVELAMLDEWATGLVKLVVGRLQSRIETFRKDSRPGQSAHTIEEQTNKFNYLNGLIARHLAYQPRSNPQSSDTKDTHPYSALHRIIRGLLVEFIHQSQNGTQPLNIEHGRNPEARAYWESTGASALRLAKLPGMFHLASSYNYLRRNLQVDATKAAKFHAVGEIVRVCIDIFKEEFPKRKLSCQTCASVYNDHLAIILLASMLRHRTAR
jgi:hypothetical protein